MNKYIKSFRSREVCDSIGKWSKKLSTHCDIYKYLKVHMNLMGIKSWFNFVCSCKNAKNEINRSNLTNKNVTFLFPFSFTLEHYPLNVLFVYSFYVKLMHSWILSHGYSINSYVSTIFGNFYSNNSQQQQKPTRYRDVEWKVKSNWNKLKIYYWACFLLFQMHFCINFLQKVDFFLSQY